MVNPPRTSGPNANGSFSLARESKLGHIVTVLAGGVALALADYLGSVDVTPLPDFLEQTAVLALGAAVGALTSWVSRNR